MKHLSPFALSFVQEKLPYSYAALEPNIDAMTMEIRYTKHHANGDRCSSLPHERDYRR